MSNSNHTPEEISHFLENFFDVVGTRQYIGARYVPVFGRKDEESIIWDNSEPYEPLTIVLYQGNSYTSRTYVPAGVDITNQIYWALTGNYNAQIEAYREEVIRLEGKFDIMNSKTPRVFSSVEAMSEFDELTVGSFCETTGFRTNGIGGGLYVIAEGMTPNDMDIIDCGDGKSACLIFSDTINPSQLGAYGDGVNNDEVFFNRCVELYTPNNDHYFNIELDGTSTYLIKSTIYLKRHININGNGAVILMDSTAQSLGNYNNNYLFYCNVAAGGQAITTTIYFTSVIQGINLKAPEEHTIKYNGFYICGHYEFRHMAFNGINKCVWHTNDYTDRLTIEDVYINRRTGSEWAIYTGMQGDMRVIRRIQCGSTDATRDVGERGANTIYIGVNSLCAIVESCVACSIRLDCVSGSVRDCMFTYDRTLTLNNGNFCCENLYFTIGRYGIPRIIMDATTRESAGGRAFTCVELTNVLFFWAEAIYLETDINYANPIVVNDVMSIKFTNVQSGIGIGTAGLARQRAVSLTEISGISPLVALYNIDPSYWNGKILSRSAVMSEEILPDSADNATVGLPDSASTAKLPYIGATGTYYYKLVNTYSRILKCGTISSEKHYSVVTPQDSTPAKAIIMNGGFQNKTQYRLYKGTSPNDYSQYVDLYLVGNRIMDNGLTVNGVPWKTVTPAESIDTWVNQVYGGRVIQLMRSNNFNTFTDGVSISNTPSVKLPSLTYVRGSSVINPATGKKWYYYNNAWVEES